MWKIFFHILGVFLQFLWFLQSERVSNNVISKYFTKTSNFLNRVTLSLLHLLDYYMENLFPHIGCVFTVSTVWKSFKQHDIKIFYQNFQLPQQGHTFSSSSPRLLYGKSFSTYWVCFYSFYSLKEFQTTWYQNILPKLPNSSTGPNFLFFISKIIMWKIFFHILGVFL